MKHLIYISIFISTFKLVSQNTVGTITNSIGAYDGYTLFTPNTSTETYLINNCGEVVNQWSSAYQPGNSCYLLENGNLLRTGKISNSSITFGGVGGHIQLFDWDNNLLWEYTYSTSLMSQHHDIYPLPNGNVLMLAVTTMTQSEAIQAGRNPSLILNGKIFNEQVVELEPVGTNQANIVWEWNIKDHLAQDFDITKDNYGIVGDHPELLDFNFLNSNNGNANWLHFNSLQYNSDLDQIILSSRLLDEVYIIDHSTTTAEAASHSGGLYGKGGDFLYRWGNPMAYDKGDETDKTLFSQHYAHWIPNGLNDAGKLMVFNNGNAIRFSSVNIFSPPTSASGVYTYDPATGYGPSTYDWTYIDPIDPSNFFSSILSSAQRLPNGNTLICDGDSGYFFEIDSSNTIVWEYVNPDSAAGILFQGATPNQNLVFRAYKFSSDYAAFIGRDLTPGNPIEVNPDLSNCNLSIEENSLVDLNIYPNPTTNSVNIQSNSSIEKIELYNTLGSLVKVVFNSNRVDLNDVESGIYFISIYSDRATVTKRIIKQ